jgi:hypothetical protein
MEFKERFKGRTSTMNKDGVIGIVAHTGKPIDKSQVGFMPSQEKETYIKKENFGNTYYKWP